MRTPRPWDRPESPRFYEAFYETHDRYRRANAALIAHAHLEPGVARLLDVGAGTGRTAEAALPKLAAQTRVTCVEPSPAMRGEGRRRVTDPRVQWRATLPGRPESFDRILCAAAIWQLQPVGEAVRTLAALLRPGGALCFNIPALYLQEPDEPGGGADPLLLTLAARVRQESAMPAPPAAGEPLTAESIEACLRAAGLRANPARWSFRVRITQDAYAAWLKIPALNEYLCGALPPDERARHIDAALATVDRASWKWERWRGWTAWK